MTTTDHRRTHTARFSSAPDTPRPVADEAPVSPIRTVSFGHKMPATRHHEFRRRLAEEASLLGVSDKWVGLQAGIEELVKLALTDQTTWDKLHAALVERVRDQPDPGRRR